MSVHALRCHATRYGLRQIIDVRPLPCPAFRNSRLPPLQWLRREASSSAVRKVPVESKPRQSNRSSPAWNYAKRSNSRPHDDFRPDDRDQAYLDSHRQKFAHATVEQLHTELSRASSYAHFSWTYELVRILIEEHGETPSLVHYTALMAANAHMSSGSVYEMRRLQRELRSMKLEPDAAFYHATLKSLAVHPSYLFRASILAEMAQKWTTLTPSGWESIIAGLLREKQIEMALETIYAAQKEGVPISSWIYDLTVYVFCETGEFDSLLPLLKSQAEKRRMDLASPIWLVVLGGASRAMHIQTIRYLWEIVVQPKWVMPSAGLCTAMLDTAARYGDVELADHLVSYLHELDALRPWHLEAQFEALFVMDRPDLERAVNLLYANQDAATDGGLRVLVKYLRDTPTDVQRTLDLLAERSSSGEKAPIALINAILEVYVHHGNTSGAISTYRQVLQFSDDTPTIQTFNVLLQGCSREGRRDLIAFILSEMEKHNIPLEVLSYDRLILACLGPSSSVDADSGVEQDRISEDPSSKNMSYLDDVFRYLSEMRSKGWWPRPGTISAICKRAAELKDERCWELIDKLEEEGHSSSATMKWKNIVETTWKVGQVRA